MLFKKETFFPWEKGEGWVRDYPPPVNSSEFLVFFFLLFVLQRNIFTLRIVSKKILVQEGGKFVVVVLDNTK